jgi:hypothetical protein
MKFWLAGMICFVATPAFAAEPAPAPDPYAADEISAKAAQQVGMLQQALGQAQMQIIELKRKVTTCPPQPIPETKP